MAKKIATAYDFLNGLTVVAPGGARAASDIPSSYPLGITHAAVISANGWPFSGVLITINATSTYGIQILVNRSTDYIYKRGTTDGSTWSAWASVATESLAQTLTNKVIINAPVTLTDAATVATNAALGNLFRCALGGDRTIGAPTNPVDGQFITYELTASGAARTPTLATGAGGFAYGSDFTGPLTQIVSGKTDIVGCRYRSTENRWWVEAYMKGF